MLEGGSYDTANGLPAFDRTKPFFPIVVTYVATLHGFIELASRGAVAKFAELGERRRAHLARIRELEVQLGSDALEVRTLREEIAAGFDLSDLNVPDDVRTALESGTAATTPLIGELSLRSEATGETLPVNVGGIAGDIVDHGTNVVPWLARAAEAALVIAYESVKTNLDQTPLCEFLRHCRHAAAHNGRFHFVGKEPVRPAEWRGVVITKQLQGTPLGYRDGVAGLLGPADPILLLWDIEEYLGGALGPE